jgi:hypothetical protein
MKMTITKTKQANSYTSRFKMFSAPVYPEAVPEAQIAHNDADLENRAFMIFESLVPPRLQGKSFVDASRDHHTAQEALRRGMTSEPPYDIILLYDLLDHEVVNHPIELLKQYKEKMSDDGLMIVRCHPWCSRHATHLYKKNNKAYLHLLFTDQELASLNLYNQPTRKDTLPPQKAYREWFNTAGLEIVYEEVVRYPLEPIFSQQLVLEQLSIKDKSLLEIQFIDYVLSKN